MFKNNKLCFSNLKTNYQFSVYAYLIPKDLKMINEKTAKAEKGWKRLEKNGKGYTRLQMATKGYKRLQKATKGYKWLQMATKGYKWLQKAIKG